MNQQDQRFFRQNFSAQSFSDAQDSQAPQATYQKASLKLKFPGWNQKQSVNIIKKLRSSQDYSHFNSSNKIRSDKTLLLSSQNPNRQSQLKMLEKFKAEILGIKHLSENKRDNVHSDGERSHIIHRGSQEEEKNNEEYLLKSVNEQSQKYSQPEREPERGNSMSHRQISQILNDSRRFEQAKVLDDREYQQQMNRLVEKVHQLEQALREKQTMIKRIRNNQQQLEDKYKLQIREFQTQAQNTFETITSLRKQLIQKEYEISELKEKNRKMSANPGSYRLEREVEILRNREKEHLETIRLLEVNNFNNSVNYSFNGLANSGANKESVSLSATQELQRLSEILSQRDEVWSKRFRQSMQIQRKSNIDQIHKLLLQQQRFIQSNNLTNSQPYQFHQDDSIILQGIQKLIRQIDTLKQTQSHIIETSLSEQLRFIKQFILKLQNSRQFNINNERLPSQSSGISQFPDRNLEINLKQQLSQYKIYVKQQQKNKKIFLEELNLYREQNAEIIKQNGYLRHQLGTLEMESKKNQSNLHIQNESQNQSKVSVEQPQINSQYQQQIDYLMSQQEQNQSIITELRHSIEEYQTQMYEHQKYIKQLEGELMNVPPQKPTILNAYPTSSLEGVQQTAELHLEIQRLNSLMETQIAQLTQVNQLKIKSYQQQMKMYQQRISIYQSTVNENQQTLLQYEAQIQQFALKSLGGQQNQNLITEANKQCNQQNAQLKNQVGGLIFANRELQRQVKERSHAVDHLWQVKQAEFQNVVTIINKIKRSSQF